MALQITAFIMLNLTDLPVLVVKNESTEKMCHLPDLKKPEGQLEFIKNLRMSRQCRRLAGISTTTGLTQTRKLKMSCVGRHSKR